MREVKGRNLLSLFRSKERKRKSELRSSKGDRIKILEIQLQQQRNWNCNPFSKKTETLETIEQRIVEGETKKKGREKRRNQKRREREISSSYIQRRRNDDSHSRPIDEKGQFRKFERKPRFLEQCILQSQFPCGVGWNLHLGIFFLQKTLEFMNVRNMFLTFSYFAKGPSTGMKNSNHFFFRL